MTKIQTCGSRDSLTDEFNFSIAFSDNPTLTFEGLTREQVLNMRNCLDCMLWDELDGGYNEVFDGVRDTIGPYTLVADSGVATKEVIETVKALLTRKVDYSADPDGILYWQDVEGMLTRPLN